MSNNSALILGGKSDIGIAIAHQFAAKGYAIQLAARDVDSLLVDKKDLELRYKVTVTLCEFDVLDSVAHARFLDGLPQLADVAVCVIGYMGEQEANQSDSSLATLVMRSNFEGPANIVAELANRFEKRGAGTLVGISSVAGERGRASNYIYGAAKAGFSAYLSGLRNRLASKGVHVVTVLPGFVDTKMTEGLDLPARLTAKPEQVAISVHNAVVKKKNIIYVLPIWRLIMLVITNIPEFVFKKTQL